MTVTVASEKCDLCGTCIAVCPSDALMLSSSALVVDRARCTGCGVCVKICPFGALSLAREDESPVKDRQS